MKRAPRRGEVYWVALDPALGTEIRKTRPAVVISNDSLNRYGSRVVVLPVTSNVDSLFPGEAQVEIRGNPARVLGDQLRSIDKSRLKSRIGTLSRDEVLDVEQAVRITLALSP
jgi:mRNA interferase MazF